MCLEHHRSEEWPLARLTKPAKLPSGGKERIPAHTELNRGEVGESEARALESAWLKKRCRRDGRESDATKFVDMMRETLLIIRKFR